MASFGEAKKSAPSSGFGWRRGWCVVAAAVAARTWFASAEASPAAAAVVVVAVEAPASRALSCPVGGAPLPGLSRCRSNSRRRPCGRRAGQVSSSKRGGKQARARLELPDLGTADPPPRHSEKGCSRGGWPPEHLMIGPYCARLAPRHHAQATVTLASWPDQLRIGRPAEVEDRGPPQVPVEDFALARVSSPRRRFGAAQARRRPFASAWASRCRGST